MINKLLIAAIAIALLLIAVSIPNLLKDPNQSPINDISWPNCGSSIPLKSNIGIIGLTGGLDFHTNKCLSQESKLFSNYSVYINTGYPGISYGRRYLSYPQPCSTDQAKCLAYNYGYNAALAAIGYANMQSVHSTLWWLDVEIGNSWTDYPSINIASLQGMLDAIHEKVFLAKVGVYSNAPQWHIITNGWLNNLPVWVATGLERPKTQRGYCSYESFTGGDVWLTQYTKGLDYNYICNDSFNQQISHLKIID